MSESGEEEQEKLITKLQIEYTCGANQDVMDDKTPWDLGLLFLTNKSVWLVNREKQKTNLPLESLLSIGDILSRGTSTATKFTEVLGADHILNVSFEPGEDLGISGTATALISADRDVLDAIRDELIARAGDMMVSSARKEKLSQAELMRKLTVLLRLNINDEEQLSYLLGVDETELVNLFIERSQLGVGAS